ncbi:3-hydroxyacyl-CoA dehydrogenase family protein [Actinacidiphila sp. ITFR-21]|uniref:3-hydroxyacyl-CoA dehydrogenase family protein n=1 Tax=Actinacidiphila sp. ITFR-21 TaxID=3075199 RepID=UPI0028895240|nr:3-hydroxyacyl-CoA dehydrogenase NAD-binding domain-containing protein [Streptomyces sp. ITFR-21]WNI14266.1 3-hydroxyacyl-CoA dehydrogenase NAD-binding domain-containing protein [Streptomyces sp. ITFR-21]
MIDDASNKPAADVGVVGAGLMGHGIAQVFMLGGSTVRIWDPDPEVLRGVPSRIQGHLDLLGIEAPVRVVLADSLAEAVAGADLVVEAVPESLRLKQELIARLDRLAPDAVVTTNTSVLRISEIAAETRRPERVVGAHWWNPPYLVPVVEVVPGRFTSAANTALVSGWLRAAGKTPVEVGGDVPGFIGNRMQFALLREAVSIVEQGICDAETVDLVARTTFGSRLAAVGPLENADFIGLDLTASILDYLAPSLSDETEVPELIRDAVDRGRLGAKSGGGLLDWPEGARERTERRLLAHLAESFRTQSARAQSSSTGDRPATDKEHTR